MLTRVFISEDPIKVQRELQDWLDLEQPMDEGFFYSGARHYVLTKKAAVAYDTNTLSGPKP